ncbi:MAG: long-chain fatty acid--CoA ligase [Bacteroidetes bacterium]|nr:long-chain fatty acid--CoA ligase [Bacteroidota bacterium]MBK9048982.1 long-chain fatty acid--CoA ligase [Bacteroidota bacterium]MBK9423206.1 long-chain fatty acid--CoA ligase [Bacteroidota bacterium]
MNVTRLFDLIPNQLEKHPLQVAFAGKENGKWITYSSADFKKYTDQVSFGLLSKGITPGDKIAIISNNRPEWNFTDLGVLQIGAIDVPVYPTISENDLKFILTDADVKIVFVSSEELYLKVKNIAQNLPLKPLIYTYNRVNGAPHWTELLETGEKSKDENRLNNLKDAVKTEDLATLLYTSGTTGNPKGVMLSHANLVSNFVAVQHLPPVKAGDKVLSFLPLNHIYERMLTYLYMYLSTSIYYAESMETIGDNIREVHPTAFSAVPRLLEKVYDKIVAKGTDLTGIKKKLFFWALELGLKYDPNIDGGIWYNFQLKLANKIIFNKWREALGGNTKAIVSGGAALQPRLARVFWAAQIPVLEGYGCTETSPVICVNNLEPNGMYVGTVGPVIEGVQIKIADDGEILCKGPNVMLGYYKRPDLTEESIDKDGYYHTGDIGEMVHNRFLKITDRKKEIFKTSQGKYIAPQMIENKLKESRFIEQAMVIGENQKFAAALIVPSFAFIREWAERKGLTFENNEAIANSEEVKSRIMQDVEEMNKSLGSYESIKKIELLSKEFSIEKGEMTPKLSLKRKVILEANSHLVNRMFS